ncbi:Mobile element protein [Leptospira interrogans serovar Hardjo str. Norma]|uniref:Uncharacterized protein n=2 Tax=Leptospira interrogans TaxID=173 RepID=M6G883_LEPIR|nr:Mobile element protein [Leptospira interrogans serovar Hardjo str. Norma]EJP13166.1 hypothetical protein LEP1GSC080_0108 [Leptospira interrogans str. FPW2026]EKO95944.1 hypothetical protein LEP1GSC057_4294 [Leptospira interrogans str. Brem 329]EMM79537.1 hypothetical protein LEP1GSC037_5273 [Leptospira interrogans str. 2006001854]
MSLATTNKSNWIVEVQALHRNPYDGHTLKGAITQIEKIGGFSTFYEFGYKGKDHHPKDVQGSSFQ